MLIALLEENGGHWVFTAPPGTQETGPVRLDGGKWLHPVNLTEETRIRHYDVISIGLLLGLLHYLHDTSVQPFFDRDVKEAWAAYESVNQMYAERLAKLAENVSDEWILVNDPHLMLVPEFLAAAAQARRRSRLAYFLGTPWCEPDYFSILPSWLRGRILASLLQCDVIGFHAGRWADAFMACCERYLPGARIDDRTVSYQGSVTRIVDVPFPLDVDVLDRMRDEPATIRWEQRLAGTVQGRRALVRADRLDLWKNLPRGFAAYEAMLERRPELAGECWFGAVVTKPSRAAGRHRDYQQLVEEIVERINARFGKPGQEAVSLIYPGTGGDSRNCVVAALGNSHAAMVNSTYDGLNLFAKEAALLMADQATLLLSVNAGAFQQLQPYVFPLDPFDLDQTSTMMESVLTGGHGSDSGAADGRRELLRSESAASWLKAVFQD